MWLDYGDSYIEVVDGQYWVTDANEFLAINRGPEVLLESTIIRYGEKTEEGTLVTSAAAAWFEIRKQIELDPGFRFEFAESPRKFEEFIAGTYVESQFDEVTVTPRSGDKGRDVIAVKSGFYSQRILDQVKAYSAHRLVTHDEVRALAGVVSLDTNTSKGMITTTADFQPGIWSEFENLMPYRLQLRNGEFLLKLLKGLNSANGDVANWSAAKGCPR
jgi:restriction system protein